MTEFTKPYCPTCKRVHEIHKIIGHEIQGVYDGILFWQCPLGHYFHRWSEGSEYWKRAVLYADRVGITIAS